VLSHKIQLQVQCSKLRITAGGILDRTQDARLEHRVES